MARFKTEINGTTYHFLTDENRFVVHNAENDEIAAGEIVTSDKGEMSSVRLEGENRIESGDYDELMREIASQMGIEWTSAQPGGFVVNGREYSTDPFDLGFRIYDAHGNSAGKAVYTDLLTAPLAFYFDDIPKDDHEQIKSHLLSLMNKEKQEPEKVFVTESHKVRFTDAEVKEFSAELALKYELVSEQEAEKKEVMSQFKARIEALSNECSMLAKNVRNGYEYRPVKVELVMDYTKKTVNHVRTDTGEIVRERSMTHGELQVSLDLQ